MRADIVMRSLEQVNTSLTLINDQERTILVYNLQHDQQSLSFKKKGWSLCAVGYSPKKWFF